MKSYPFKKFDEKLYFNQTYIDCRERNCRYLLIYLLTLVPNTMQEQYENKALLMFCCDLFVDWVNHFFMVKLNGLSPDILNKLVCHIRNFVYAVHFYSEKGKEIEEYKVFDLKDVNLLNKRLPEQSLKCGFRINYIPFPYIVIVNYSHLLSDYIIFHF